MRYTQSLIICALTVFFSPSVANESFESIAGFYLGQECLGPGFAKKPVKYLNPNNALDMIEAQVNQHESLTAGGHSLRVRCSPIDNRVYEISLTSEDPDAISDIRAALEKRMAREPDDKSDLNSPPRQFLGITVDGINMEVGWPRVIAHPRLPQIRTCAIDASGSSV